jgi:hypothetical protein
VTGNATTRGERPLSLQEFADAQRARLIGADTTDEQWVAVGEEEVVLWTETYRDDARRRLFERFERDPGELDTTRLLCVRGGEVTFTDWPRGGTPMERALALGRRLGGIAERGDVLVEHAAAHYLRAAVCTLQYSHPVPPATVLALSWFDTSGAIVPVGLLREDERGGWQLFADARTPELSDAQVIQRIAEWAGHHTGANITADQVRALADFGEELMPTAANALVRCGLDLAKRLSRLPPFYVRR